MVEISAENIKTIHLALENHFPKMEKGIFPEQEPLLYSLVEKPSRVLYGKPSPYHDIITRAAVLMEALTRWHIFVDGNKRTGLMTAFIYLYANKVYLAIPIDSVKFTIKVADNRELDEESTNKLIAEIAEWLKTHSATDEGEFFTKVLKYMTWPALKVTLLYFFGFRKRAQQKIDDWYALKTHKDYQVDEAKATSTFLQDVMREATSSLLRSLRTKKRKKKKSE